MTLRISISRAEIPVEIRTRLWPARKDRIEASLRPVIMKPLVCLVEDQVAETAHRQDVGPEIDEASSRRNENVTSLLQASVMTTPSLISHEELREWI